MTFLVIRTGSKVYSAEFLGHSLVKNSCQKYQEELSFISHSLQKLYEGVSFWGWSKFTDLSHRFVAVPLGEVGCLLHTVTLPDVEQNTTEQMHVSHWDQLFKFLLQ